MKRYGLVILALMLTALAVFPTPSLARRQDDANQQTAPNFTRLVFIGDSLTAGFQSGALSLPGQQTGYAALLARQANARLVQPEISSPGIGTLLQFTGNICRPSFLQIAPASGIGTRTNPTDQVTNLAVPGATTQTLLEQRPRPLTNPPNTATILTDVILGLPGLLATPPVSRSQIEWAEALQPTFLVCWIGNNEILGPASAGTDQGIVPVAEFERRFSEVMRRARATGATIVVATIADVTSAARFATQEEVARFAGTNLETVQFIFGVKRRDRVIVPEAFLLLAQGPQRLPENVVLRRSEILNIQAATREYNRVIREQAAAAGAIVVDTNAVLANLAANGLAIPGVGRVTTRPFGGLFSLDGVHPSATGYAATANAFIDAINARFRSTIPQVDLRAVALADPLACKATTGAELETIEQFRAMPADQAERLRKAFEDMNRILHPEPTPIEK